MFQRHILEIQGHFKNVYEDPNPTFENKDSSQIEGSNITTAWPAGQSPLATGDPGLTY